MPPAQVPEPGSDAWIALRNRNRETWMMGNQEAIAFLAALGAYVEMWDDLIDKDKPVSDEMVNDTLGAALLHIACNPFVAANRAYLFPLLVQMISSYEDSEILCRDEDERCRNLAFHLRNYPLELYQACAFLVGGWEHLRRVGPEMRRFFAFESYSEWEFANG